MILIVGTSNIVLIDILRAMALVVTPSLLELGTVLSWAFAFRVSPLARYYVPHTH
jgi:hypothetical protein